jgi:CHAD domain-containing protein
MPLDARELDRRVNKLRKSLKGFSKDPTVDDVHDLRTRTRRVESILLALELDSSRSVRKLLSALQLVRRRAGKVRDMDVLTSYVVGLGVQDDSGCIVRLLHHLGGERHRYARKLHSIVQDTAPELRKRLKRSRRKLDSTLDRFAKSKFDLESGGGQSEEAPLHAMSVALRLCRELAAVQRLGPNNLHAYRLEVKRLRYVLEMAESSEAEQRDFIDELKDVQDRIGEWHDLLELAGIAHQVLKEHRGCKVLAKIEGIRDRKFKEALRITEEMRHRYLPTASTDKKKSQSHRGKRSSMPGPVLVATSEIAA